MAISKEHKELLLTQSKSKTLPELVEFFNGLYTKKQIYDCLRHMNNYKKLSSAERSVVQSQNARKYHINQDFFKSWSSDMAYMFGFWCADGCIYGNRMFDITIHAKDKYLIKRFAELLEYEGPVIDYADRQAARINFSCKVIYDDIVALGGTECKSLTLQFPNVPNEYLSDFIRGYFDGDGCVMDLKGNRLNTAFTCGSKAFLDSLLNVLKKEASVEGGSYDATSRSLKFGKKDSIKLYHYMYKNNNSELLFLLRKRNKFLKYI